MLERTRQAIELRTHDHADRAPPDGRVEARTAAHDALAHEPPVVVGDDREHRVDLALADERFERLAVEPARHGV